MPLDSMLETISKDKASSTNTANFMWDTHGSGSGAPPDDGWIYGTNTDEGDLNWPLLGEPGAGGGAFGMDEDAFLYESDGGGAFGMDETTYPGYYDDLGGGGGASFTSEGGGGGAAESTPISWVLDEFNQGDWADAPSWFRPMTITDESQFNDPRVSFTLMANSMIGSGGISDEDSRSLAKQLYGMWGGQTADNPWDIYSDKFEEQTEPFTPSADQFKAGVDPYDVERLPIHAQVPITGDQAAMGQTGPSIIDEKELYSGSRGTDIINALSNARELTVGGNVDELGPGYQYLQNIAGEQRAHAGEDNFMTRAERQSYRGAIDPLLAQSEEGALGPYSELARMASNPFFTNMPTGQTRLPDGTFLEGERNSNLSF